MKKLIVSIAFALIVLISVPIAACGIEDWRYYNIDKYVKIEGTTTCESGKLFYRLYDKSGSFVASGWTYFERYVFEDLVDTRHELFRKITTIKYIIKED